MSEAKNTASAWTGFESDRLPAGLQVPSPQRSGFVAKVLIALFLGFLIAALLAPWTQNIRGSGRVVAYSPDQRQQSIEATISGRISKWFVQEGTRVKKGDPIVELADNDARILDRLGAQRSAVEVQRIAQGQRLDNAHQPGRVAPALSARGDQRCRGEHRHRPAGGRVRSTGAVGGRGRARDQSAQPQSAGGPAAGRPRVAARPGARGARRPSEPRQGGLRRSHAQGCEEQARPDPCSLPPSGRVHRCRNRERGGRSPKRGNRGRLRQRGARAARSRHRPPGGAGHRGARRRYDPPGGRTAWW